MRKLELFCSFQLIWLATGHPDSGHAVPPGKEYRPIRRLLNQRSKDRCSQESSIVPIPPDRILLPAEEKEVLGRKSCFRGVCGTDCRAAGQARYPPPTHNGESWCDLAACARNLGTAPPSIFSCLITHLRAADMPYYLRHPSQISVSSHFLVVTFLPLSWQIR